MDNITILDLFLMLAGSSGNHQANIDVLKSLYERTHSYYLATFSAALVLAGGITGGFIALLAQEEVSNEAVMAIIIIALAVLLVSVVALIGRLNRLQRSYLDILQIYNMLARFF